ncbi:MAG: DedA family protein [Verrucomicrobiota bacterium]|nr:DedA family protein [Verrucomicrobiota bacterium]
MEAIKTLIDFILHMQNHLDNMVQTLGPWVYVILFLIIFCETGLVVTPFLPGDSLLFAVGAIAARPNTIDITLVIVLLCVAAILGDTLNYWIGHFFGPKVFKSNTRFLNKDHLIRTHEFYERYGGKTIIIARFVPIIRTFAPFVAGIGRMTYSRFMMFNVVGGLLWICSLTLAGYFFGNFEVVKKNFGLVIIMIIILSVLPAVVEFYRERSRIRKQGPKA